MTKNILRDELLKVATELLAADLNAHRLTGRSLTIGYFKEEKTIKDIIEIAAALIEGVDIFCDDSRVEHKVNLSFKRDDPNFKQPPFAKGQE